MSTCVRKCTFARACNVGANSLNVVSRTFPHFSQSMLTPTNVVVVGGGGGVNFSGKSVTKVYGAMLFALRGGGWVSIF